MGGEEGWRGCVCKRTDTGGRKGGRRKRTGRVTVRYGTLSMEQVHMCECMIQCTYIHRYMYTHTLYIRMHCVHTVDVKLVCDG